MNLCPLVTHSLLISSRQKMRVLAYVLADLIAKMWWQNIKNIPANISPSFPISSNSELKNDVCIDISLAELG